MNKELADIKDHELDKEISDRRMRDTVVTLRLITELEEKVESLRVANRQDVANIGQAIDRVALALDTLAAKVPPLTNSSRLTRLEYILSFVSGVTAATAAALILGNIFGWWAA